MESALSRLTLPYGERTIRCELQRRTRTKRSVAIHVEPDGRVLVEAPLNATNPEIRAAVTKRLAWIHQRVMEAERRQQLTPRQYVSGETVLYLGRRYRLKVLSAQAAQSTGLRGGYLEVAVEIRTPAAVRDELERWFRERAGAVLPARLTQMSEQLRWVKAVPPVSLRRMSRQWGSCSPSGRIALNVGLIRTPVECIDYVLLHELIHLKAHNHSPAFYRTLDRHLPEWQRIKTRLDSFAELALAR